MIEDLKQNIKQLNEQLHNQQSITDQLNNELEQSKKSNSEISITDQQSSELQQTIVLKNDQIEEVRIYPLLYFEN